jgi:putative hydrolase of the HAD superfamily
MTFTTIFFDLDDTLYPASSGLWPALKVRMSQYMIERMHIPAKDVPGLREEYFCEYGTTLRGLQARHNIDAQDFLAYVHDVKLTDYIQPDPLEQSVLASLPTRNLIFTNSDVNHARRVLRVLQIEEYFADIVDVNRMNPYCKPNPEAFALALKIAGESNPSKCIMIDDMPNTVKAAKALGLYSVLFGAAASNGDSDATLSDWRQLPALLKRESSLNLC